MANDNVSALSIESLNNAIVQYKQNYNSVVEHIQGLERQKVEATNALHQVAGAIAALEQVIQNVNDEAKQNTTPPTEPPNAG